jgi:succinate dehydrogenase / fumarate reductase, flavoprotein subunit
VRVREAARELAASLERGSGDSPYALQRDLQDVMQRLVGIFRVESDLQDALAELAKLRARWPTLAVTGGRAFNPGWDLVFELRNLLIVSEGITRSALQRKESRGAHSRLDYTETESKWGDRNSIVRRRLDGAMEVTTTALPPMPDDLRALLGSAH